MSLVISIQVQLSFNLSIPNSKPKTFWLQHDATSENFHTMKLCFMHKIVQNLLYKITIRLYQ
jgi:hypothetical protein